MNVSVNRGRSLSSWEASSFFLFCPLWINLWSLMGDWQETRILDKLPWTFTALRSVVCSPDNHLGKICCRGLRVKCDEMFRKTFFSTLGSKILMMLPRARCSVSWTSAGSTSIFWISMSEKWLAVLCKSHHRPLGWSQVLPVALYLRKMSALHHLSGLKKQIRWMTRNLKLLCHRKYWCYAFIMMLKTETYALLLRRRIYPIASLQLKWIINTLYTDTVQSHWQKDKQNLVVPFYNNHALLNLKMTFLKWNLITERK